MLSMPPPTPTSTSPARMAWSSSAVARTPDAQTLLTVSDETSFGMPGRDLGLARGDLALAGLQHLPHDDVVDLLGLDAGPLERRRMAMPPSSVAGRDARLPPIFRSGCARCRGSRSWACPQRIPAGDADPVSSVDPVRTSATTDAPVDTPADTVALGVFDGKRIPHDLPGGPLQALLDTGEARTAPRALAHTHAAGKRWILVGLGSRDAFEPEDARIAAGVVAERARELGTRVLTWELPHRLDQREVAAFVEGTLLAAHRPADARAEPGPGPCSRSSSSPTTRTAASPWPAPRS
jgi:hypothetical protein